MREYAVIEHAALRFSLDLCGLSTVSRARRGGPPFAADGKRVRITIGNGSRVETIRADYTLSYRIPHPAAEDKRRGR